MKICFRLFATCNFVLLSGCVGITPDKCEQSLDFPLEITAYVQGIGGIVDIDSLSSICVDR